MHRPSSFEKQIIYLFQGFANESCLQRFLFCPGFVSTLGSAFGLAPALAGLRPRFFTPMFLDSLAIFLDFLQKWFLGPNKLFAKYFSDLFVLFT